MCDFFDMWLYRMLRYVIQNASICDWCLRCVIDWCVPSFIIDPTDFNRLRFPNKLHMCTFYLNEGCIWRLHLSSVKANPWVLCTQPWMWGVDVSFSHAWFILTFSHAIHSTEESTVLRTTQSTVLRTQVVHMQQLQCNETTARVSIHTTGSRPRPLGLWLVFRV